MSFKQSVSYSWDRWMNIVSKWMGWVLLILGIIGLLATGVVWYQNNYGDMSGDGMEEANTVTAMLSGMSRVRFCPRSNGGWKCRDQITAFPVEEKVQISRRMKEGSAPKFTCEEVVSAHVVRIIPWSAEFALALLLLITGYLLKRKT